MKGYEFCNLEWDNDVPNDSKNMTNKFHSKDFKICVWINLYCFVICEVMDESFIGGLSICMSEFGF